MSGSAVIGVGEVAVAAVQERNGGVVGVLLGVHGNLLNGVSHV